MDEEGRRFKHSPFVLKVDFFKSALISSPEMTEGSFCHVGCLESSRKLERWNVPFGTSVKFACFCKFITCKGVKSFCP